MKNERYSYIDTMKGIAMLAVVSGHIFTFSLGVSIYPLTLLVDIQIPLFFFASGFLFQHLLYRKPDVSVGSFLRGKFMTFIVGAIVLMIVNSYVVGGMSLTLDGIGAVFFNSYKNGYWFTITLFVTLSIAAGFTLLCRRIKPGERKYMAMTAAAMLILYAGTTLIAPLFPPMSHKVVFGLLGWSRLYDSTYFFMGMLVYCAMRKGLLDNGILITAVLVLYLICVIAVSIYDLPSSIWRILFDFVYHVSGVFVVFTLLRNTCRSVDGSRTGRAVQTVGRRSLEVYFLHYFFIYPLNLRIFAKTVVDIGAGPLLWVPFLLILVTVVSLSLVLGKIICMSPVLAKLFFAEKAS